MRTDVFHEQFFRYLLLSPIKALRLIFRSKLSPETIKSSLSDLVDTDATTLPYNKEVMKQIEQAKDAGYKIVLATAAHEKIAGKVAQYLGVFDDVIATTDTYNCKGLNKLKKMQEYAQGNPFEYIGDSQADIAIFNQAKKSYVVGSLNYDNAVRIKGRPPIPKSILKAMRPHQWAKNSLIFLPLLTSHTFNASEVLISLFGFVCFSLAASAVYIINDMLDIEDDRRHFSKRNRPFAKGMLSIKQGIFISGILFLATLFLSYILLYHGIVVLCVYIALTFFYSSYLKSQPMMDVFCLSLLYSIRVFYGHVINGIDQSSWLLAFCSFFFLSLAFMKRSAEIEKVATKAESLAQRRGYGQKDEFLLKTAGICSGLISILVLCLYISSEKVSILYANPDFLWVAAYVLLFWKLRMWLVTTRGKMDQDPVLYTLKDPVSYVVAGLVIIFGLFAKVF